MNSYQVEYVTLDSTDEVLCGSLYVDAMTREDAVYKAFDELADQGLATSSLSFGEVKVKHDSGKYISIMPHKEATKT